jgi:hypothetical protein
MHRHSHKQIIFTPLGSYNVTDDDNPDSHKSGWTPEDFVDWATISFQNFHPLLQCGAFFAWHHCSDLDKDFERVKSELNNKSWAK